MNFETDYIKADGSVQDNTYRTIGHVVKMGRVLDEACGILFCNSLSVRCLQNHAPQASSIMGRPADGLFATL
jgi:hypothetical protein